MDPCIREPFTGMTEPRQKPIFHALLHVGERQDGNKHANIRGGGNPLDIYIRCAGLCARSVAYHGYGFRLVTDKRDWIERRFRNLGLEGVEVIEHDFMLAVPEGIRFRSAHFKLELYDLLGSGGMGDYVGVIDVDTVMTKQIEFPPADPNRLLAYDITKQIVAECGSDSVRSDLEHVSGRQLSACRWFGGEFLFGHPEAFRRLAASVFRIWPKYLQHVAVFHHVGDEMLVAAAMPDADLSIGDAGQLGFVVRWWTARTKFEQIPFDVAAQRSILHLPSDKEFLANSALIDFCPKNLIARFRRKAGGKILRRRIFSMGERILGQESKYVARLS
jgi:hypothetical protein